MAKRHAIPIRRGFLEGEIIPHPLADPWKIAKLGFLIFGT